MKKIKSSVTPKDRIVIRYRGMIADGCRIYDLFFNRFSTKEDIYLFSVKGYSVFRYFQKNGRRVNEAEFSLTLKQLYDDRKSYGNYKLGKLFDRLPGMIDYAIENSTIKDQLRIIVKNPQNTFDEKPEAV